MIAIISHPDCLLHNQAVDHPECPERLLAISKALSSANLDKVLCYEEAPLATYEQLSYVHEKEYIDSLLNFDTKGGLIFLDPDTILGPHSMAAALRAAGAVIKAVDLVMTKKVDSAFCNIRPPGHHAEYNQSLGFCFFNNIAIGVSYALDIYQLKRILIVDFDVHRGNGTEAMFIHNNKVLICSSYEEFLYPFNRPESAKNIIHIPLPFNATGKEFRTKITEIALDRMHAFKPELVFFSAGFDAHREDPLSSLNFIESDYAWITKEVKAIADQYSQGRMISVLEGGYALTALGLSVVAHIKELI